MKVTSVMALTDLDLFQKLANRAMEAVPGAPERAEVIVVDPRHFSRTSPIPHAPRIAFLPCGPNDLWHPATEACVNLPADAFAGDVDGLASAFTYVTGDRDGADAGPLRLTFLGALGTGWPNLACGATVHVDQKRTLGRSSNADMRVRQGAHSDQNIMARLHASLEPHPDGALVRDLGSTNGTSVDGVALRDGCGLKQAPNEAVLTPGARMVVAGCLVFQLDGALERHRPAAVALR